jgi:hypothetical protein
MAFMLNDVASLVKAAAFAIMDRVQLVSCQVLENGMTLDYALVTNRNMRNDFHNDKYKYFRLAVNNYVP